MTEGISDSYNLFASNTPASVQKTWSEASSAAGKLGGSVDSAFKSMQDAYKSGKQDRIQKADLELRKALAIMEGFSQSIKAWFETLMSMIRKLDVR